MGWAMGRRLAVMFVIGVALVLGSVIVTNAAPSSWLPVPLFIVGVILFGIIIWAVFVSAWRTKGWSIRHPGREE